MSPQASQRPWELGPLPAVCRQEPGPRAADCLPETLAAGAEPQGCCSSQESLHMLWLLPGLPRPLPGGFDCLCHPAPDPGTSAVSLDGPGPGGCVLTVCCSHHRNSEVLWAEVVQSGVSLARREGDGPDSPGEGSQGGRRGWRDGDIDGDMTGLIRSDAETSCLPGGLRGHFLGQYTEREGWVSSRL